MTACCAQRHCTPSVVASAPVSPRIHTLPQCTPVPLPNLQLMGRSYCNKLADDLSSALFALAHVVTIMFYTIQTATQVQQAAHFCPCSAQQSGWAG